MMVVRRVLFLFESSRPKGIPSGNGSFGNPTCGCPLTSCGHDGVLVCGDARLMRQKIYGKGGWYSRKTVSLECLVTPFASLSISCYFRVILHAIFTNFTRSG